MAETFVIVGASLAGATAAATLRDRGFDGRLVLIGEEQQPPYERPPLSKEYMRGEAPFEKALVRAPEFFSDAGVETRFGVKVERVDTTQRSLELAADSLPYDKLLLTTGSRNRRLPLPGLDLEGIYDLRTVEDADRIRAEAAPGRKVVLVGMGFIGAELAASMRQIGLDVTVVEIFSVPLERALGREVGAVMGEIHREQSVEMFFEDQVERFEGGPRVERVVTKQGRKLDCDFAVVGVGVEPVTDLADSTDIRIDNGIVVDELCRTSVEDVFAAGDVTNHYHPVFGRQMRVEHWQNAIKQGEAAAKSMLGAAEPYDEVHWIWSDQYEHKLQYAGFAEGFDQQVMRGSIEERNFTIFYLKEERLVAAVTLNRGKEVRQSMRVIKSGVRLDPVSLQNEDVEVRSLI
jgi:3-phenylpropionate/trans-cinnamate dioxygenase ferredoxin reductase subunit